MQYIVDIILLGIFGLLVFLGVRKGLFYTLFELAAYVVSVLAARFASVSLTGVIYENYIKTPVKAELTSSLGSITGKELSKKLQSYADSIPTQLDSIMQMIGIDKQQLVSSVSQNADSSGKKLVSVIMKKVVEPVSSAIIQTLLFIVFTVILVVVLRLIIRSLDKFIKDLPFVGKANGALGGLLGAVKGIFAAAICAMVIGALAGLTKNEKVVDSVNNSYIIGALRGILTSISGYSPQ